MLAYCYLISICSCLSFATLSSAAAGQEGIGDRHWLKELKGTSDIKARSSKDDWTGAFENPECPGNVLTLQPGEKTRIVSHKSYGKKSYPDNYMVSWYEKLIKTKVDNVGTHFCDWIEYWHLCATFYTLYYESFNLVLFFVVTVSMVGLFQWLSVRYGL